MPFSDSASNETNLVPKIRHRGVIFTSLFRAFLDSASESSYITTRVAGVLNLKRNKINILVSELGLKH